MLLEKSETALTQAGFCDAFFHCLGAYEYDMFSLLAAVHGIYAPLVMCSSLPEPIQSSTRLSVCD